MWRIVIGICVCLVLAIAGCGDVEWFPNSDSQLEPTPNAITAETKLCVLPESAVQWDSLEVTGVTAQATVKIDYGEYSFDGSVWHGAGDANASFVTPTDQKLKLWVRHTSAKVPVSKTDSIVKISVLKVGNTSGIFTSVINTGQTICQ